MNFQRGNEKVFLPYLKVPACREEGEHTFRDRPYFQPVIGFKTLNGKGNGSRNDDQCSFRGRGIGKQFPGITGLFRRIASKEADQKVRVYQQAESFMMVPPLPDDCFPEDYVRSAIAAEYAEEFHDIRKRLDKNGAIRSYFPGQGLLGLRFSFCARVRG